MMDKKKEIIWSIAISVVILCLIFGLSAYGVSRRVYATGQQTIRISEPFDAFDVWLANRVRGRVLILFDRKLNAETSEDSLTRTNYIFLAIRKDIVRKVYHIVPDAAWPEVSQALETRGYFLRTSRGFKVMIDGASIEVMTIKNLPPIPEPVLVNINSSVWGEDAMNVIRSLFAAKRIDSDIVTISSPFLINSPEKGAFP